MISILIPTYNYNVYPLVSKLDSELASISIPYEIIVGDDGSPKPASEHSELNRFQNLIHFVAETNLGRTGMRQLLAEKAAYPHLLFLDADVMPKKDHFVQTYAQHLEFDIVSGGIDYEDEKPSNDKILRWVYGRERETQTVAERMKGPYLAVNSGCFLIKKELFLKVNAKLQWNAYGMDNYFKELLRMEEATVMHIDNPVVHLGLESNEQFLKKSLEAIDTTVLLERENLLKENVRPLQKSYLKLKRWGLTRVFSGIVSLFRKKMERNFVSNHPNLFCFDLYRLEYYIQLKRKKDA